MSGLELQMCFKLNVGAENPPEASISLNKALRTISRKPIRKLLVGLELLTSNATAGPGSSSLGVAWGNG